jgi:hypothetical protein
MQKRDQGDQLQSMNGDLENLDGNTEAWLHKQVAPAFDRLRADPSRALTLEDVRAMLAAEHRRAIAE